MTDIRMATLRARLLANDPWTGADIKEFFKKSSAWWARDKVLEVVDTLAAEIESRAADADLDDIVARQIGRHRYGAKGADESVSSLAFQIAIADIDRLLLLAEDRKAELDAHLSVEKARAALEAKP